MPNSPNSTKSIQNDVKNPRPTTAIEIQKQQLERLMAKPDQPIYLPQESPEAELPPIKEFVSNVQGSSAGAGSGDFHVYRAHRRRELARQHIMASQLAQERKDKEFAEYRQNIKVQEEAKSAKNRAQRLKKKKIKKEISKKKHEEQELNSTDQNESVDEIHKKPRIL